MFIMFIYIMISHYKQYPDDIPMYVFFPLVQSPSPQVLIFSSVAQRCKRFRGGIDGTNIRLTRGPQLPGC